METPIGLLRKHFKFEAFKGAQEEIIQTVLAKKDCLAILPTGGGKSLCYQIPGMINPGVCIVISPLISLMEDQVKNLINKQIKAISINSTLKQDELIRAFDNLQHGHFKFLYLSPEKLQSTFIQDKIKQLNVNLVAIDEAHCISQWGHDFRPAYLKIKILKEIHPNIPILALTATATKKVQQDIIKSLQIDSCQTISQSLIRKNLIFKNLNKEAIHQTILNLVKAQKGPAIVYTNTRKKTKDISQFLNKNRLKACYFHGGLSIEEKKQVLDLWTSEQFPIMVATTAFGMGIDKENVGLIIHIDLPYSLENYMQEAGRAGRDGRPAFSYVIVNENSKNTLRQQTERALISVDQLKTLYKHLNHYFNIGKGELPDQDLEIDLDHFCKHYNTDRTHTAQAISLLDREQILQVNQDINKRSTIRFTVSQAELFKIKEKNRANLINVVLRSYGGVFDHPINITEYTLAKKSQLSISELKNTLELLAKDGLLEYQERNRTTQIRFLVPREDDKTINRIATQVKTYNNIKQQKMLKVIDYAENIEQCRSVFLLSYFDETDQTECGLCDICLKKAKKSQDIDYKQLMDQILDLLSSNDQLLINEIISGLDQDASTVIDTLHLLLETDKIRLTSQNKLQKVKDV